MPAFSLTTPKKAAVSGSPPVTPSDVKPLADLRSEIQQAAPLRRGERAKIPSSKARPPPPPPASQTKPATTRVNTKPPTRYDEPPPPSPPGSESDEISVATRPRAPVIPQNKAKTSQLKGKGKALAHHNKPPTTPPPLSDGEEISVASVVKTPQRARPKRKAVANAPPLVFNSSTPSEVPPTPPRSKLKRKAAKPPSPEPTPSTIVVVSSASSTSKVDAGAILEVLEQVVESEVSYWKHYTNAVKKISTSYASITLEAPVDDNTRSAAPGADAEQEKEDTAKIKKQKQKQEALIYILETLPLRYKALATAYACKSTPDMEFEDPVLSDDLQNLLNISRQTVEAGGEDELEGWYDSRLFEHRYNQKFRDDVLAQDAEARELEAERMKSLEVLLQTVADLKCCAEDRDLANDGDDECLKSLIGAMDEMGLAAGGPTPSPSPGVKTLPGRVRMSGVNSEDEWVPE